jgi:succinate dehydrogenase / fumarate reductase iron-sulfur subunit
MNITFKVRRYGPSTNGKGEHQSYSIDVDADTTVLDALTQIRDEQDGTLAFRGSCRSGFCGDCSMRVNGKAKWTCRMTVGKAEKDGEISLEPPRLVTVVKDLMYDQETFMFDKYKAVKPWIEPSGPVPEGEYLVPQKSIRDIQRAMSCTLCGLCDEGCTVLVVDKTFLGPAALTKAYRVMADPRDGKMARRLMDLSQKRGMWDCVHCFEATEHCPKGIDPTDLIFAMRDEAIKRGIGTPRVVRHNDSFAASVKSHGWLDEARLAIETEGFLNPVGLARLLPTALRAMAKRKAPMPYLHSKREGADKIKRIFKKWEATKK